MTASAKNNESPKKILKWSVILHSVLHSIHTGVTCVQSECLFLIIQHSRVHHVWPKAISFFFLSPLPYTFVRNIIYSICGFLFSLIFSFLLHIKRRGKRVWRWMRSQNGIYCLYSSFDLFSSIDKSYYWVLIWVFLRQAAPRSSSVAVYLILPLKLRFTLNGNIHIFISVCYVCCVCCVCVQLWLDLFRYGINLRVLFCSLCACGGWCWIHGYTITTETETFYIRTN